MRISGHWACGAVAVVEGTTEFVPVKEAVKLEKCYRSLRNVCVARCFRVLTFEVFSGLTNVSRQILKVAALGAHDPASMVASKVTFEALLLVETDGADVALVVNDMG